MEWARDFSAQSEDKALWNALRAKRKDLAQEHGAPAYIIFHYATLIEMVVSHPSSWQNSFSELTDLEL